jgi:hypothetical protein
VHSPAAQAHPSRRREKDVAFEEPEDDVHASVDTAYHAKYDR